MAVVRKRSPIPPYLVAGLWILWGIFLPLYTIWNFLILALCSVGVLVAGRLLFQDKTYTVPDPEPEPEPLTPDQQALQDLCAERDRVLLEMHRLNDAIADEKISAQIDHLEEDTRKIVAVVVKDPAKLPQLRKFLNYYLPTTLKILNAYDRMDSAGVAGSNIDGTMGKIETMMDTVVLAFDKQLDSLFGDEAMDIGTDITVLEQMLAREGIGGTQIPTN